MDQRLSMVTLGVDDVGRSRAFYERLGWRPSPAGNEHVAFFAAGGAVLALFGRAALAEDAGVPNGPAGFSGITLAHNVPTREAVAQTLEHARAVGARIIRPAEDVFWGGVRGIFADPDGHLWEVAWNPHFPLDANGTVTLP